MLNKSDIMTHDQAVNAVITNDIGWGDYYEQSLSKLGVNTATAIPKSHIIRNLYTRNANSGSQVQVTERDGIKYLQLYVYDFQPDVVFIENITNVSMEDIITLRGTCEKKIKIITHLCAPKPEATLKTLSSYDLVLCCSPAFVNTVKNYGGNPLLHYHACPDYLFDMPLIKLKDKIPRASFFGTIKQGRDFHDNRRILLEKLLLNNLPIDIYGSIHRDRLDQRFIKKLGIEKTVYPYIKKIFGNYLKKLDFNINPPLFGKDMARRMMSYLCTINSHGGIAGCYAANARLFEATGLGVCLLTENQNNLSDLFIPDVEVLTYSTVEECANKIKLCLREPEMAYEIGKAGMAKCKAEHTFDKRARELHAALLEIIN